MEGRRGNECSRVKGIALSYFLIVNLFAAHLFASFLMFSVIASGGPC